MVHGRGRQAAGRGDVSYFSRVSVLSVMEVDLDSVASRVPAAGRV